MALRDPDENLVPVFKYMAFENPEKTLKEGRPVFDDIEVCEIRSPGSKDVKVFPSTALSTGWIINPITGQQHQISYAERFSHQYQQFKAHAAQTKSGTPLDHAPFLTEGRRAELRAQNVYTVEMLAAIDGIELKNLGPGGREWKNQAMAYIEEAKAAAPNKQMMAELEALRARNQVLEEDAKALRATTRADKQTESELEDMSSDQLRDYITAQTGQAPHGTLPRKSLMRMAIDATPKEQQVA